MEQSGDIRWRRWRSAIGATLFLSVALSGCTPNKLDAMRPEVNGANGMVVFPDTYVGIEDLEEDDGAGSAGPEDRPGIDSDGTADSETGGPGGAIVSGNYAPLEYNVVAASDYSEYLNTQVFTPVSEVIVEADNGAAQHLYFRVFHSGYEPVIESATQISRGSVYDNMTIGSVSHLAGTAVPMFAYQWLKSLSINGNVITNARANWLSKLNKLNIATTATWIEASANKDISTVYGSTASDVILMWGNARFDTEKFQDYLRLVSREVIGVIPNIQFQLQLNARSKTSIVLNETAGVVGSRYSDWISKRNVDRLFGYYNQYPTRSTNVLELVEEDDYGIVWAYIDGYSKTLVVLACEPGYTLSGLLGSKADDTVDKLRDILNYTQWTEVSEFVENLEVLQKGVRGID